MSKANKKLNRCRLADMFQECISEQNASVSFVLHTDCYQHVIGQYNMEVHKNKKVQNKGLVVFGQCNAEMFHIISLNLGKSGKTPHRGSEKTTLRFSLP